MKFSQNLGHWLTKYQTVFPPRLYFNLLYALGYTEWDSANHHEELENLLKEGLETGHALEIGCGTGSNVLFLLQRGWEVTGIDASDLALWNVQRKAKLCGFEHKVSLIRKNILDWVPKQKYNLVLDVGCFVGFSEVNRKKYIDIVYNSLYSAEENRLGIGGVFLLFSFPPRLVRGHYVGIDPENIEQLFLAQFTMLRQKNFSWDNLPATWYWFLKR